MSAAEKLEEASPELKSPRAMQILEAAEALLEEEGYEALSAKAVADRAGLNKALIFYYWTSTQRLFEKVLERFYIRHKSELAAAFAEGNDLSERMHRVVDCLFDSMGKAPIYPRVVQQQMSSRGDHVHLVEHHLGEILTWLTGQLGDILPEQGPLSLKQFHLSMSAVVINFFTYGPAFDMQTQEDLEERRAHVHWVVDACLSALEREPGVSEVFRR